MMSDNFVMLADVDATPEEAGELSERVVNEFRKRGIITGNATADCVYGGVGFRPGPQISNIYKLAEHEGEFWTLITSGVEVRTERGFNMWALAAVFEGFNCPKCRSKVDPLEDKFGLGDALNNWLDNTATESDLICPQCSKKTPLTKWECRPPLAFSNLAFTFWNWPPFDLDAWQIDIATLVEDLTKHTIVRSYGHI